MSFFCYYVLDFGWIKSIQENNQLSLKIVAIECWKWAPTNRIQIELYKLLRTFIQIINQKMVVYELIFFFFSHTDIQKKQTVSENYFIYSHEFTFIGDSNWFYRYWFHGITPAIYVVCQPRQFESQNLTLESSSVWVTLADFSKFN